MVLHRTAFAFSPLSLWERVRVRAEANAQGQASRSASTPNTSQPCCNNKDDASHTALKSWGSLLWPLISYKQRNKLLAA
ncbi:hypothetical protein PFRA20S_01554 [Pseudomonas fragi]|nr:hypothetical protein SAMN05216594_3108 [Pseudomonas fragi]